MAHGMLHACVIQADLYPVPHLEQPQVAEHGVQAPHDHQHVLRLGSVPLSLEVLWCRGATLTHLLLLPQDGGHQSVKTSESAGSLFPRSSGSLYPLYVTAEGVDSVHKFLVC